MSGRTTRGTKRKLADVVVPPVEAAAPPPPPAAPPVPETEVSGVRGARSKRGEERRERAARDLTTSLPRPPPATLKTTAAQVKRLVQAILTSIAQPVLSIDRVGVRRLAHQLAEYCKRGEF